LTLQRLLASLRVVQAVTLLAQALRDSRETVLWCKETAARAGDRAAALVPALQALERAAELAPGQGVDVHLVESICVTLVMLAKVGRTIILAMQMYSVLAGGSASEGNIWLSIQKRHPLIAVTKYWKGAAFLKFRL
jgi:hypothetical protein